MKKIIYSLVIMIAAGSLFTSCVENTEPQGIRDLREAKADYLASLSKLREADAEKVKAEAAVEQAKAEVQKAIAAQNQALAEAQQIANEAARVQNEEAAAKAKAAIDSIKAKAEQDAIVAKKTLAEKQADLDSTLRNIAALSIGLTGAEKEAIATKTAALNTAYGNYNEALNEYNVFAYILWDAEYNVVAGVKGFETAESFQDTIADRQDQIALLESEIARLEALKEEPAGVKDTLDAIAEEITALDAEITTKGDVRTLYEASLPFVDAKKEFKERVKTFKEDSIKVAEFKFVDEDEDGNEIPVAYELTDGKGVDKKFGNIINNNKWVVSEHLNNSDAQFIYYYLFDDGFYYAKNAVQVGKVNGTQLATPEQLTEGLDVLDQIVETLNRELVVIDNIKDSTSIEDAKKAAHVADSTYKADRAILEIGFEKSKFAKKVTDSLAKLAADTVAEKAKYTAADADLKTKVADKEAKESAKIVAVRTAAAAYNAAVDAMATAVRDYDEEADSAAFIKAIQAFGKAQAALNGYQDSLTYKSYDPYTGLATTSKDAFSAVNPKFFVKGEEGHPVYNESFPDIVKIVFGNNATFGTKKKDLVAGLKYNPLKEKGTATDSINVLKEKNQAVKAAVEAYAVAEKAATRAKDVADSLKTEFGKALTDFTTYKTSGTTEAKAEYTEVYNKFWGYNKEASQPESIFDPYKFPWTDKTFLEPENCVEFTYFVLEEGIIGAEVLNNSPLKTILDNVDHDGYLTENSIPNKHRIFRNKDTYELTEFAQAILKSQIVEDLGEYVPNKARLEKINAQVAQIREDVEAAIAEYEAGFEGLEEVLARFYGVDEDGEIINPYSEKLEAANVNVDKGKWAFGGYLLAWAEELAPEYPAIVKDAEKAVRPLKHRKANLAKFKETLDNVYTTWWNTFEKEGDDPQANVKAIVDFFKEEIKKCENSIKDLKNEITYWEKAVAACEAGYSPAKVKVDALKSVVEIKKAALEQAEEALARAKKEYNEVIAKYGVNE